MNAREILEAKGWGFAVIGSKLYVVSTPNEARGSFPPYPIGPKTLEETAAAVDPTGEGA